MRWNSWRNLALICVLGGALMALAGTLAGRWASSEAPAGAKPRIIEGLRIESSALEFGEAWGSSDFAIRLPLTNISGHSIQIDGFETACDCQPTEPKSLTLAPGETREIRLTFDPAKLSPGLVGRSRFVESEIRPILHGRPTKKGWRVRGIIRPLIATDLTAVLFGESHRASQTPIPRRVKVQLHDPGELTAEVVPPVAEAQVLPGSGPTDWIVVVTPFAKLGPGPFRGVLTIANRSPEGERTIASLALPVEGVLREGGK